MKYKVKEVAPNVFAVFVKDKYERAMLFCRVQEFYESPRKEFNNGTFSMWDYFRWYSRKTGCFSYPKDFSGFNLPLVLAKKCQEVNECETPYDLVMNEIVEKIFVNGTRQYLIGVDEAGTGLFEHELAHGLYYTSMDYKRSMDAITKALPREAFAHMKSNLKEMGYCSSVTKDEIQAYFATESRPVIGKGVKGKNKIHKEFRSVFRKYKRPSGG